MDTQPNVSVSQAPLDVKKPEIDPLRRIFIPIEKRTTAGTFVFRTHDNLVYARLEDGSVRRAVKKVRGKAARRADKQMRRAHAAG